MSGLSGPGRWGFGRYFGGYVLAFHNLPAEVFEDQIESLTPDRPVSLTELVNRQTRGESTSGLFAITVDDGVGTTVRELSGVCIRRRWPVTFYLPSGYLDEPSSMAFQWKDSVCRYLPQRVFSFERTDYDLSRNLGRKQFVSALTTALYTKPEDVFLPVLRSLANEIVEGGLALPSDLQPPAPIGWDEVQRISRDPHISFESHGVSHNALSALSPSRVQKEALDSQRRIREVTGQSCQHFCYPYGGRESIGDVAPAILGRSYQSAVTMIRGRLTGRRDLLRLPRIPIYYEDEPRVVQLKVMTW